MTQQVLRDLEPKIVWEIFEEITKVPRPSKKEEKIRQWLKKWAKENNINSIKEDSVGNILLSVEATPECKNYPTLVMQAHMDMVCQKEPEVKINFEEDPLELQVEGNKISAKGTSLGADNGIGMAYGLAALISKDLHHGPLEVLLTVDEETGLTGAFAVKAGFFTGKYLLNVDSESVGTITISSAGGGGTDFDLQIDYNEVKEKKGFQIIISGLQGGHSGVDIDLPRLNAIKVGIDALLHIPDLFSLCTINAGTVHNAIPRDCEINITVDDNNSKEVKSILEKWKKNTQKIGRSTEPGLEIKILEKKYSRELNRKDTNAVVNILNEIYHGPISFSKEIEGLVQTSNNLALVKTTEEKIHIHVSTRSSVDEELVSARKTLKELGEKYEFELNFDEAYPGWKPDPKAPFITLVHKLYKEELKQEVKLQAIHAGLECGLFSALDPELQIASIGPNIKNAHSPDEYVEIESVEIIWKIVRKIIENMNTLS